MAVQKPEMGFILLSKTSSTLKLVSTSWLGWHDVQGEGNLWGVSHTALRWVFNIRGTCLHVRINIFSPLTSWSQVTSLVLMPNSWIWWTKLGAMNTIPNRYHLSTDLSASTIGYRGGLQEGHWTSTSPHYDQRNPSLLCCQRLFWCRWTERTAGCVVCSTLPAKDVLRSIPPFS